MRCRIDPHAHGGFLIALDGHKANPVTSLSFCASTVSARSLTFSSGNESEVSRSVRIGVSAGLTLL